MREKNMLSVNEYKFMFNKNNLHKRNKENLIRVKKFDAT